MVYDSLPALNKAANRVLFRTQSVFPLQLFPDVLEVTDTKVTIIYGIFIGAKKVMQMPIIEIHNVSLTTSLLFASLTIELKGFEQNPQTIRLLPRGAAIEAEAIISGLILCALDKINTLEYSKEELLAYIRDMGEPETVTI